MLNAYAHARFTALEPREAVRGHPLLRVTPSAGTGAAARKSSAWRRSTPRGARHQARAVGHRVADAHRPRVYRLRSQHHGLARPDGARRGEQLGILPRGLENLARCPQDEANEALEKKALEGLRAGHLALDAAQGR